MKKYFPSILFVAILLFTLFSRLYLLGEVPAGLTNDEVNTGYDSYSLLHTARDQWGNFLPLSFRGFGDYPAPLYRYVLIPIFAVFGPHAFALRLPSAVAGIALVIGIFFLAKKMFPKPVAFLAMLFAAISPWAIGMDRIGLESPFAAALLVFSLLCFLSAKTLSVKRLLAGTILLALTVYTYAGYTLLAPATLCVILFLLLQTKQLQIKKAVLCILAFIFLILPLLINKNATAASRFSQVGILHNITSIGLINTLNDQRGACQTYLPTVICKLEGNKVILFSTSLFSNYVSHFSFDFLYINGTPTQNSVLYERGLEYLFGSILFLLGIAYLLRGKQQQKSILLLLLLAALPDSLTGPGNYSRAFSMLPFLVLVEASGAYVVLQFIKQQHTVIKTILFAGTSAILIVATATFCITYFTYFRDYYSRFSQYGYGNLMQQVAQRKQSDDRIYITSHLNDTKQYIYYLWFTQYNPTMYQTKKSVVYHTEPDGWVSVDKIDNIYFTPGIPDSITLTNLVKAHTNVLLISHPSDFPKEFTPEFVIKDRIGYGLFEGADLAKLLHFYETAQDSSTVPGK